MTRFLEDAAVAVWPNAHEAHRILRDRLHEVRDRELENTPLYRDFGGLLAEYAETLGRIAAANGESPIAGELRDEMSDFRKSVTETYPRAAEVFSGGLYETEFLETFDFVVFVDDLHGDRATQRHALPDTGEQLYPIGLDALPAAPAVAPLA